MLPVQGVRILDFQSSAMMFNSVMCGAAYRGLTETERSKRFQLTSEPLMLAVC